MAHVKLSVSSLCKLLKSLISIDAKPEHLRLAKFNTDRQDVVQVFSELLRRLLQIQNNAASLPGHVASPVELTLSALGAGGAPGTRQLLLALGRLVTERTLDVLVLRQIFSLLSAVQLGVELPVHEEQRRVDSAVASGTARALKYQHNYAVWLAGRIRHAANDLAEQIFADKVCPGQGGAWLRLSETELVLRHRPDLLAAYLCRVAAAAELLEAYKHWRKSAPIFVSWMESVREGDTQTSREKVL